jgi:hypothetical protein
MRRSLRIAVLVAAAALQIAAPLSAYARVAKLPDAGDLCSAAKVAPLGKSAHDAPQPRPAQHHCAQSLCCIGGATGAAAPPCVPAQAVLVEFASVMLPAATTGAAPASIIAAASARGPPPRA